MNIEERAKEYADNFVVGDSAIIVDLLHKVAEESYIKGATEQKAIDDAEHTEEMRKLNEEWKENLEIQRKMLIEKACEWLKGSLFFGEDGICIGSYTDTMESILNDFCKAMEE